MDAILALCRSVRDSAVPARTLDLVRRRAGQIGGCAVCIESGASCAALADEWDDRLLLVGSWRGTRAFSNAERAALALTESIVRLEHPDESVPDDVWAEATRHYDERGLASLLLAIASPHAVVPRTPAPVEPRKTPEPREPLEPFEPLEPLEPLDPVGTLTTDDQRRQDRRGRQGTG